MRFTGFFTSKRGTEWNYHFYNIGWVEMWHGTTERITGGWRIGRDVFSPNVTKECYQAIEEMFGFRKNPDHENEVIIPDMSHDELIEKIECKYGCSATISKTTEGSFRMIKFTSGGDACRIKTFDSFDSAKAFVLTNMVH